MSSVLLKKNLKWAKRTFLINHVVQEVLHLKAGTEAVFVTPTGKAATVLIKNGTVAGTVHSLIYTRNEDDFDVDENGELVGREVLSFTKKEKIDEKIRLIIVDEASMIGEDVLHDLLSFEVKCLFCGDNAQLPPVNGTCSLLQHPDYKLTEIVRQAADNPIIRIATMAREGKTIPYGNYDDKVCVVRRNFLSGAERRRIFLKADQIICGRNRTRAELNREIRGYKGIDAHDGLREAARNGGQYARARKGNERLVRGGIFQHTDVDIGALEHNGEFPSRQNENILFRFHFAGRHDDDFRLFSVAERVKIFPDESGELQCGRKYGDVFRRFGIFFFHRFRPGGRRKNQREFFPACQSFRKGLCRLSDGEIGSQSAVRHDIRPDFTKCRRNFAESVLAARKGEIFADRRTDGGRNNGHDARPLFDSAENLPRLLHCGHLVRGFFVHPVIHLCPPCISEFHRYYTL